MFLVQLLLPLTDNAGAPFPNTAYCAVADELTHRFGGVTAYTRAPAEGRWKEEGPKEREAHDEILIMEVMVHDLDRTWWQGYRRDLEARFAQDALVVRAHAIETL